MTQTLRKTKTSTRVLLSFVGMVGFGLTALGLGSCSPESPKLVHRPADNNQKIVNGGSGGPDSLIFAPKIDILFVIANDSSMSEHQANVQKNSSLFTAEIFKNKFLDYHIGVINGIAQDQNLGGAWGGRLNGPHAPNAFVDPTTVNPDTVLFQNMNLGSQATDPVSLFTVVKQAFTSPIKDTDNKDFLRADADLAIMFISDTDPENGDDKDSDQFYDFLVALKGGDAKKISVYAAFDNSADQSCGGEDYGTGPKSLNRILELFKGRSYGFNLCDAKFGQKMAKISYDISASVGRTMRLNRIPDPSTIQVAYGSQIIPNDPDAGWSFDAKNNALIFGTKIVLSPQPPGTQTTVTFTAAKFQDQLPNQ